MRIYEKYSTTGFESYEDFAANYKTIVPDNFNFGFDVVDELAKEKPTNALLWTNDRDEDRTFTFAEISALSATRQPTSSKRRGSKGRQGDADSKAPL